MAPQVSRINGPRAIRTLAQATHTYLTMLQDASEAVRIGADEGDLVERESVYAHLLLAMTQAERDLRWVGERCALLLGEAVEG
jgi:hypothetical protein